MGDGKSRLVDAIEAAIVEDFAALEYADRLLREGVIGDRGLIASMIVEAMQTERERCAAIIEHEDTLAIMLDDGSPLDEASVVAVQRHGAERIRNQELGTRNKGPSHDRQAHEARE